jgi:hypothetical protein
MNRLLWTIIAALLLAGGLFGLLAGTGALPTVDRQSTVLTPQVISAWNSNETLATTLTIVGGVLLALVGLLMLRVLLRRPGGPTIGDLEVQQWPEPVAAEPLPVERAGRTTVTSRALHHALRRDLETSRQIRRAGIRLTGPTHHPQLEVRLAVLPGADIVRVADHLDQAIDRFATTSGVRPDIADVNVRIPERTIAP